MPRQHRHVQEIKNNFSTIAQHVFEETYLQRFDKTVKPDLYALPVERVSHGVQHVSRVAALVRVVANFYRFWGHPEAADLTEDHITLLQVVALCHDAMRQNDLADKWEQESRDYCRDTLIKHGIEKETAEKYADLILLKDKGGILGRIFQSADSLDIMRVKDVFSLDRASIAKDFQGNPEALSELKNCSIEVLQLIASQHDLKKACDIQYGGKSLLEVKIEPTRDSTNPVLKQIYEQNENAYPNVAKSFNNFGLLKKYYADNEFLPYIEDQKKEIHADLFKAYRDLLTEASVGFNDSDEYVISFADKVQAQRHLDFIKQQLHDQLPELKEIQASRAGIHEEKAYNFSLSSKQFAALRTRYGELIPANSTKPPYLIKCVRADQNCFVDSFIKSITRTPGQQEHLPLRLGPKKRYTVKGDRVYFRATKEPQYSAEQKADFSQPQSTSLVTEEHDPKVFGFTAGRKEKLIGFLFDRRDALFNRMFIYDGGTVTRPYDFDDEKSAKKYAKAKAKGPQAVLFSDEAAFKKALNKHRNQSCYNEVLARLRWNKDGTGKIFISSDNLESRLLAQEYARRLTKRLQQQARELGQVWDNSYQIPICFYMPEDPKHLQSYNGFDQIDDKLAAQKIYKDQLKRFNQYNNSDYEFLLALDNPADILLEILPSGKPLLLKILEDGYVHIVRFLLDRADADVLQKLTQVIPNHFSGSTALEHAARAGDKELVKWLIECNSPLTSVSKSLLYVVQKDYTAIVKMLLNAGADPNTVNEDDTTLLALAAKNGHLETVKAVLEAGADVNKIEQGKIALSLACDSLVKSNAAITQDRYRKILRLLIEASVDGHAILKDAVKTIDYKKMQELVRAGVEIDSNICKAARSTENKNWLLSRRVLQQARKALNNNLSPSFTRLFPQNFENLLRKSKKYNSMCFENYISNVLMDYIVPKYSESEIKKFIQYRVVRETSNPLCLIKLAQYAEGANANINTLKLTPTEISELYKRAEQEAGKITDANIKNEARIPIEKYFRNMEKKGKHGLEEILDPNIQIWLSKGIATLPEETVNFKEILPVSDPRGIKLQQYITHAKSKKNLEQLLQFLESTKEATFSKKDREKLPTMNKQLLQEKIIFKEADIKKLKNKIETGRQKTKKLEKKWTEVNSTSLSNQLSKEFIPATGAWISTALLVATFALVGIPILTTMWPLAVLVGLVVGALTYGGFSLYQRQLTQKKAGITKEINELRQKSTLKKYKDELHTLQAEMDVFDKTHKNLEEKSSMASKFDGPITKVKEALANEKLNKVEDYSQSDDSYKPVTSASKYMLMGNSNRAPKKAEQPPQDNQPQCVTSCLLL